MTTDSWYLTEFMRFFSYSFSLLFMKKTKYFDDRRASSYAHTDNTELTMNEGIQSYTSDIHSLIHSRLHGFSRIKYNENTIRKFIYFFLAFLFLFVTQGHSPFHRLLAAICYFFAIIADILH